MGEQVFARLRRVRTCSRCKQAKPESDFNTRGAGRLQTNCRVCNAAYLREHYRANREYYIRKARRYQLRRKREHYAKLRGYFAEHPCVDCGESDPVVLQFDHVRGTKTENVGSLVAGGYPWSRIEAEIAKCDVRCANCHWRKTARQFGWYASLDSDGG